LNCAEEQELEAEAQKLVAGLSLHDAHQIVKAFATYFELTNLAETNHRKRRRRAARLQPGGDKPGSMRGTLQRLKDAGCDMQGALTQLARVSVIPVFTAHPTEVARRVVRYKRRRLDRMLECLDRLPLSASEAAHMQDEILTEITPCGRPMKCAVASRRWVTKSVWASTTIGVLSSILCPISIATWQRHSAMCTGRIADPCRVAGGGALRIAGSAVIVTAIPSSPRRPHVMRWSVHGKSFSGCISKTSRSCASCLPLRPAGSACPTS
jgi:hypothetical protein